MNRVKQRARVPDIYGGYMGGYPIYTVYGAANRTEQRNVNCGQQKQMKFPSKSTVHGDIFLKSLQIMVSISMFNS